MNSATGPPMGPNPRRQYHRRLSRHKASEQRREAYKQLQLTQFKRAQRKWARGEAALEVLCDAVAAFIHPPSQNTQTEKSNSSKKDYNSDACQNPKAKTN